jgi:hypothetical protein
VRTAAPPRVTGLQPPAEAAVDLLRWPGLGRFLLWRHSRAVMQAVLVLLSGAMIVHGLFGPQLAPKNLATTVTWVHYRGALVFGLLVAGNLMCMACPFLLPRDLARRFFRPARHWPARLRNKWIALALFVLVLFAYELFDLWASPWATALLILAFFAGALGVDAIFKNASFCKYVCPIGQFNFVASTVSPLEVRARDLEVCASCRTLDCIGGRRDPADPRAVVQRGCELGLFLPRKVGNLDCTFCMDCVHACPHENVAVAARLPAAELWADPLRSGIGRLSQRADLAILAVLFTFGALLNAFGMVGPVYTVQARLASWMGTTHEAPVLGVLFVLALVVEPVVLIGLAALATRKAAGTAGSLLAVSGRFVPALVPLGFGVWLAHYGFHLLTGLGTVVPALQLALSDAGLPLLGAPDWSWGGLPEALVYPIELGLLGLGVVGSMLVAFRLAEREAPARPMAAFLPWAALCALLGLGALWLLSQPMEMRGTFLAG